MNIENYNFTLQEILIMLRNISSYIPNMDYESISNLLKQEANDYIMHESLQVHEFIKCCDSTLNQIDISIEDKSYFIESILVKIKTKILENQYLAL